MWNINKIEGVMSKNKEPIENATMGLRVRSTRQRFNGIITKEQNDRGFCTVKPDKKELKELYPYGIRCNVKDLIHHKD